MKKYLLLLVFTAVAVSFTQAQHLVGFQMAQNHSTFKFIDSNGVADENILSNVNSAFGINYSYVLENGVFFGPELGYKKMGASSILNDKFLNWDLHYVDFCAGGGYSYNDFAIKPFVSASFYAAYLFKANQTLPDSYINLMDTESLKNFDFGVNVAGGIRYQFANQTFVFAMVRQSFGLMQLENLNNTQKLYNRAFSLNLGFIFDISMSKQSSRL